VEKYLCLQRFMFPHSLVKISYLQGLALQAHGGQLLVGQTVDLVETGQGLILQVATAGELEFSRLGIGLGFGLVARLLGHLLWC